MVKNTFIHAYDALPCWMRHNSNALLVCSEFGGQQMLKEYLWMRQLHISRDAASGPVLHPLDAAVFVKTKQFSQLGWPAHIGNKLLIVFEVGHGSIKRDV